MSRRYREKGSTHLKEAWVPLIYTMTKEGRVFNWVGVLSLTLSDAIGRAKYHAPNVEPEFYMSSFILYILCAKIGKKIPMKELV